MSSDSARKIRLIFCTILLRLVALNTKNLLCSIGAFVFKRCYCVRMWRKCLIANDLRRWARGRAVVSAW